MGSKCAQACLPFATPSLCFPQHPGLQGSLRQPGLQVACRSQYLARDTLKPEGSEGGCTGGGTNPVFMFLLRTPWVQVDYHL